MSKYTTEVRFICESEAGLVESQGFMHLNNVLNLSAPKVFDFDFPIFDESYRLPLEIKILRHYYTREICEETYGLWKLRLCDRLNMIMPYYNQMYKSALLEFNPFYDVDISRTHAGQVDNESSSSITRTDISSSKSDRSREDNTESERNGSTVSSGNIDTNSSTNENGASTDSRDSWDKYSDTPQGAVTGLASDTYLTNARNVKDDNANIYNNESDNESNQKEDRAEIRNDSGKSTLTGSESLTNNKSDTGKTEGKNILTGTDSYIEMVKGKQGGSSYSSMLLEFRKTMVNIDAMVIEELNDLFFGLW